MFPYQVRPGVSVKELYSKEDQNFSSSLNLTNEKEVTGQISTSHNFVDLQNVFKELHGEPFSWEVKIFIIF